MKKIFRFILVILLVCIAYILNRPQAPISQKVLNTIGIVIPPQGTGYTTWTAWIPNAASRYCEKKWWTVQVLNGPDGRYAMCHLANGKICEVRSYYRGECGTTTPGGWGWGGGNTNDTGSTNDTGNINITWTTVDPCTLKDPVCASVPGICPNGTACPCDDGTTCPQIQKTFQNICLMNLVKSAKFLYKGVCQDPTTPPSSTTK